MVDLVKREARKEVLRQIPWVKELKESDVPCDGIRWNQVPLKAVYKMHDRTPTGLSKYRCKNKAKWHFTAKKTREQYSQATSGNYCMAHLFSAGLYYNMDEEKRLNTWYRRVILDKD